MRVYLDACSLQRPMDDRSQPRVNVEAEAILTLLRLVENGDMELVSSEVLVFEVERTPDPQRRAAAGEILQLAHQELRLDEDTESEAADFVSSGVRPLDALHLALASRGGIDYFCTCDDKLRKKAQRLNMIRTTVVTPLELVLKVMP